MHATEIPGVGQPPTAPHRDALGAMSAPATEEEMRRRAETVASLVAWYDAHDTLTGGDRDER